jgi:hypothetical protein
MGDMLTKQVTGNASSPALQQNTPYQYADTSLATLFPLIQRQGGALSGLLESPSASSGAGRFLSEFPVIDYMQSMTPQGNYTNNYVPSEFIMPSEAPTKAQYNPVYSFSELQYRNGDGSPTGNMGKPSGVFANLGKMK